MQANRLCSRSSQGSASRAATPKSSDRMSSSRPHPESPTSVRSPPFLIRPTPIGVLMPASPARRHRMGRQPRRPKRPRGGAFLVSRGGQIREWRNARSASVTRHRRELTDRDYSCDRDSIGGYRYKERRDRLLDILYVRFLLVLSDSNTPIGSF